MKQKNKIVSLLMAVMLLLSLLQTTSVAFAQEGYGLEMGATEGTFIIGDNISIPIYLKGTAGAEAPVSAQVELNYSAELLRLTGVTAGNLTNFRDTTETAGSIILSYYDYTGTFDSEGKLLIATLNFAAVASGNTAVKCINGIVTEKENPAAITITELGSEQIAIGSYPWEGKGTENVPYLIKTADDLVTLARFVNELKFDFKGIYFKVTNDIDLSSVCGETTKNWQPIGCVDEYEYVTHGSSSIIYPSSAAPFGGNFDGGGYEIKNLYYKNSDTSSQQVSNCFVGLFGYVLDANIKNVTVNGSIECYAYAGGIAAWADGEVNISGCTNKVSIKTYAGNAGGIAGNTISEYKLTSPEKVYHKETTLIIADCVNYGEIRANKTGYVGGIAMHATEIRRCANHGVLYSFSSAYGISYLCTIDRCYNDGEVSSVSGIASGIGGSTVTNCYNTGSITSTRNNSDTGYLAVGISYTADYIANCYNVGTLTSTSKGNHDMSVLGGVFPIAAKVTSQENNYYLDTVKAAPDGYTYIGISQTSEQLKALAPTLGEAFFEDSSNVNNGYPILDWQAGDVYDVEFSLVNDDSGVSYVNINNKKIDTKLRYLDGSSVVFSIEGYNTGKYKVGSVILNNETDLLPSTDGTYSFTVTTDSIIQISIVKKSSEEASGGSNSNVYSGSLSGDKKWDGTKVDVSWYIGHEDDTTYEISTAAELMGAAALVNGLVNEDCKVYTSETEYHDASWWNDKANGWVNENTTDGSGGSGLNMSTDTYHYGVEDFNGKTIKLTSNLDMGGIYDESSDTWSGPNFMPIGGQYLMKDEESSTKLSSSFCGTFDGDGHYVYNIYCDRHCSNGNFGDGQSVGLIGRLGVHDNDPEEIRPTNPTVRNVGVTGYIYANRSIGGIVGKTGKTAYNNENLEKVTDGYAVIENCVNYARIIGTDAKGTAGVVGAFWNGGICQNCYNMGNVTGGWPSGGIAGTNENTLLSCYNAGMIDSTSGDKWAEAIGSYNGDFNHFVVNCWWLEGTSTDGGYFNRKTDDLASNSMTADSMKDASFVTTLGSAYDVDTDGKINGGYPVLKWQLTNEDSQDKDDTGGGDTGGGDTGGGDTGGGDTGGGDTGGGDTGGGDTGGGDTGGGDTGGTGGGGTDSKTDTDNEPVEKRDAVIIDSSTTVTDDSANVDVTADAVKKSINEAKKSEATKLIIKTDKSGKNADDTQITIPAAAAKDIADSKLTLRIETADGSILTLDKDFIKSVSTQIGSDDLHIVITAKTAKEASEAVKSSGISAADAANANIFEVQMFAGSKQIKEFKGKITLDLRAPSGLKAGDTNDVYRVDADGKSEKHTGNVKSENEILVSEVTASGMGTFLVLAPKGLPFTDVSGHWAIDAITYVYNNGLFNGVSDTLFAPNSTMTRAMLVTVLYRMEKTPAVTEGRSFSDVKSGTWYTDAVSWASSHEIVKGFDDGTFGPNKDITREQMAAILMRYAEYKGYDVSKTADISAYTDASKVGSWALDDMRWAVGSGLITGIDSKTLAPKGNATRAQVATILMRFQQNIAK